MTSPHVTVEAYAGYSWTGEEMPCTFTLAGPAYPWMRFSVAGTAKRMTAFASPQAILNDTCRDMTYTKKSGNW